MKHFTQIKEGASRGPKLDVQENTINYIDAESLELYLKIAGKCINNENATPVIKWLIVNNETYLHDLDPEGRYDNALAGFYEKGKPKKENLVELWNYLDSIAKMGNILDIPVFQTQEQFDAIISKKVKPDEILMGDCWSCTDGTVFNITTVKDEKGNKIEHSKLTKKAEENRVKLFNKYHKAICATIVRWQNATGRTSKEFFDELMGVAAEGFYVAVNCYGHKRTRDEHGKWVINDEAAQKETITFGAYAISQVNNQIMGHLEQTGVHIPKNQLQKMKQNGQSPWSLVVSGDKVVGQDNEGNGKTLFDYIENSEAAGKKLDAEDIDKNLAATYKVLDDHFSPIDMEIFYRVFNINGYDNNDDVPGASEKHQPTNVEIAKYVVDEYNKKHKKSEQEKYIKASTLSTRLKKILEYIRTNKKLSGMFREIQSAIAECKQERWREEEQFEEGVKVKGGVQINDEE